MRKHSIIQNIQQIQIRKQFQNKNRFKTHVNIIFDPSTIREEYKFSPHKQSPFISNLIIQQILTNNVYQILQQIQMERIVNQTLKEFQSIFQQFKVQYNPYGPEEEIVYENIIKIQEQPINRLFDPMLGFDKFKHIRTERKNKDKQNVKTNHLQQIIQNKQRKSSKISCTNSIMRQSKLSIISQKSIMQSSGNHIFNIYNNPALIPLRIQNQRVSQINAKRNLQDFLRQKKNHRQSTLTGGFIKPKILYEDKDMLKIIQQYERPKIISRQANTTTKSNNNVDKIVLFPKQQFAFDYNGDNIQLKKSFSNVKKNNLKILKSPYKIKQTRLGSPNDRINKQKKIIKIQCLPILKQNNYSKRNTALTARGYTQQETKQKILSCLMTQRTKFRQLGQNQTTINLKEDQMNLNFQFVKSSANLLKNIRSERGTGKSGRDQQKSGRDSNTKGFGNILQGQFKNKKLLGFHVI